MKQSPFPLVLLCLVFIAVFYIHTGEAFRMRRIRVRVRRVVPSIRVRVRRVIPSVRVRRVIPSIRTRRLLSGIRSSRLVREIRNIGRIRVRRGLDHIKDMVDDLGDGIRDSLMSVAVCTRISKGRVSNRCHAEEEEVVEYEEEVPIEDPVPEEEDEEAEVEEVEFDFCRNITPTAAWGAPELTARDQLVLPIKNIAIYMGEDNCVLDDCRPEARALYTESESYNFLIDGRGKLYEGRGWHSLSDHHLRESHKRSEFGIVLIMTPDAEFEEAFDELLFCGLQTGAIDSTFNATTDLEFRF